MNYAPWKLSMTTMMARGWLFTRGILLLLVKLLMTVAWYVSGAFAIGWLVGGRRGQQR